MFNRSVGHHLAKSTVSLIESATLAGKCPGRIYESDSIQSGLTILISMADQNEKYIDSETLKAALRRLHGTSDHLLKIWLTLKQMGLSDSSAPVLVTTSSPNDALVRLFSYGDPNGGLHVPFSHMRRFMTRTCRKRVRVNPLRSLVATGT